MSIPQYTATSAAAPAEFIVFCEVSAAKADWLKEATWVQKLADNAAAAGVGAVVSDGDVDHAGAGAGAVVAVASVGAGAGASAVAGAGAAATTPTIGAIIAQPPPGFGVQPVAAYTKQLDELQALPLVRGLRVYFDETKGSPAMLQAWCSGFTMDSVVLGLASSLMVDVAGHGARYLCILHHELCLVRASHIPIIVWCSRLRQKFALR
jgi:hypothetical protein